MLIENLPNNTTPAELFSDARNWSWVSDPVLVEEILEKDGLMGRLLVEERDALARSELFLLAEYIDEVTIGNIYIGLGSENEATWLTPIRWFKDYVR